MDNSDVSVDIFETYSYVRGASHVGKFADDTLANMSSFLPAAVSTTTKVFKDDASCVFGEYENNESQSLLVVPRQDQSQNEEDRSSLGLLHSGHFKSMNITKAASIGRCKSDGFSFPWDDSAREIPRFSADFGQQDIRDNLEFIVKEEALNKAEHRFIQEEVISGDGNGYCETSSWSVSRGANTLEEKRVDNVPTPNDSTLSVSSYFQKHSGPLGQFNGSIDEFGQRPTFGVGTVIKKKNRNSRVLDGAQQKENEENLLNLTLGSAGESFKACCGRSSRFPADNSKRNAENGGIGDREQVASIYDITAKPPRGPARGQADSISKLESTSIHERSSFCLPDSSSFLSLSRIQAYILDASAAGNESILAKQIVSTFVVPKRKKNHKKSAQASGVGVDGATDQSVKPHLEKRQEKSVLAECDQSTKEAEQPKLSFQMPQPDCSADHHSTDSTGIPVEMKIGNIIYKGVLRPQPTGDT